MTVESQKKLKNEELTKDEKENVSEKKPKEEETELSEEDKQLNDELTLCVERLKENNPDVYKSALEILRTKIRSSTSSITAVPKPLKFLRPHYKDLKVVHENMKNSECKGFCADVISVLGMTISEERECLKYRLIGSKDGVGTWGHEYVRHLSGEIGAEWNKEEPLTEDEQQKILNLVKEIIPYDMSHNAETEACDLLMEIEQLDLILEHVDETTVDRVCLYLHSCVPFLPDPENSILLKTAIQIFRKFEKYPDALRLSMQYNDLDLIKEVFYSCKDKLLMKQLAFALRRQQIVFEVDEDVLGEDMAEEINDIMSNSHLNTHFLALARELDIIEPKVPEDIYKTHLENSRLGNSNVDSARMNLASSYVNGFVNCGFGSDKLLLGEGNKWIYRNKEHGMMATTASLGMVLLWDVDGGLQQIDKFLYSSDDYIKAGALLACGIVNTSVKNECDPALALLTDYVLNNSNVMRIGSILGLGLAYAGTDREDIYELITPAIQDSRSNMEVKAITALSLGLVGVGSCNSEVLQSLIDYLMTAQPSDLKDSQSRFFALAIGLLFLGKQDAVDTTIELLETVPEPFKGFAVTLVEACAYAGTGNVLKIQEFLHTCSDTEESTEAKKEEKDESGKKKEASKSPEKAATSSDKSAKKSEKKSSSGPQWGMTKHAAAVLGIGLVSMGEDIGSEMSSRMFGHLYRYGDQNVKRTVPLALALTSISNPQLNLLDTLSKFSHDNDNEVVHNAIFGMGLAGAGTNNARLAQMLRNLAQYYSKDQSNLFLTRISQGLVHLGKGTMSLQPYHSARSLLSPVALAGILASLVTFLDSKTSVLGKSHYLLYSLATAIQPRMLQTFDEDLKPLPVSVRVGQAVDVVGQAGKPKTITGFQTHTTPVLLSYGERAELATEEYIPLTNVIEGFVILKKNPDYE